MRLDQRLVLVGSTENADQHWQKANSAVVRRAIPKDTLNSNVALKEHPKAGCVGNHCEGTVISWRGYVGLELE